MSQPVDPQQPPDLLGLVEWIDQVADRFEAGWQGKAPPPIRDFLGESAGASRTQLLKELVKIDLEHRWRSGDQRKVEEYLGEWPELVGPDGWMADDLIDHARQVCQEFSDAGTAAADGNPPAGTPGAVSQGGSTLSQKGNPALPTTGLDQDALAAGLPKTLGKFQLGEVLGRGAFGVVYRARDTRLGTIVALKALRAGRVATLEEQQRFLREARSAAQLRHPNIVRVHEFAEADGIPYIVSEYVEGRTLADLLAGGRPPFAEAATLVARIADALDYAHRMQVIHRDIKPSNILLDGVGQPYLTDFGLALRAGAEMTVTVDGQILGTPAYMSPEQATGQSHAVDQRSDIYSLGVILYELLSGQRPFPGDSPLLLHQVAHEEPPPPRKRNRHIPRDLETICLKAMAKSPGRRYATAGELGEDLRRFLNDEPIRARPAGRLNRLARWCRRNPAVAGLLAAVLVSLLAGTAALGWAYLESLSRERVQTELAAESRAREQEQKREALLQRLQAQLQARERRAGWSQDAWDLAVEAAGLHKDDRVRNFAVATLAGLDARAVVRRGKVNASAIALAPSGLELLLGGTNDRQRRPLEGARIFNIKTGEMLISRQAGAGPVAFGKDGRPLQLVHGARPSLLLWDPGRQEQVSDCPFAADPTEAKQLQLRDNNLDLPLVALSAGAAYVAAALEKPNGDGTVVLWEGKSGHILHQFPRAVRALAFAPDSSLLALGGDEGTLRVYNVADGEERAAFSIGRARIHALALSPDNRRLAVGHYGGLVTIWDWRTHLGLPCYGSDYDVDAVAFSPDGSLLASGGRITKIWDAATGRQLLDVGTGPYVTGLAFSEDGRRLAVSTAHDGISYWSLEHRRGLQTLRGLTSTVDKVCLAPDGRWLAALSHTWEVGLWEVSTGRLRAVYDAPEGVTADNAALAFSPDGLRLAYCAGTEARCWDVVTAGELRRWPDLPPGFVDFLAFHPTGKLLLFRVESRDRKARPYGTSFREHPRVGRVRDLLGLRPLESLHEFSEFNEHVLTAAAAPDGSAFVIDGIHDGPDGRYQRMVVLDGLTGRERWGKRTPKINTTACHLIEPEGRVLATHVHGAVLETELADLAAGKLLRTVPGFVPVLGPGARDGAWVGDASQFVLQTAYALGRIGDEKPRVMLAGEGSPTVAATFSLDGRLLVWGNADGTVTVADLEQLRARLADVGLGW